MRPHRPPIHRGIGEQGAGRRLTKFLLDGACYRQRRRLIQGPRARGSICGLAVWVHEAFQAWKGAASLLYSALMARACYHWACSCVSARAAEALCGRPFRPPDHLNDSGWMTRKYARGTGAWARFSPAGRGWP